MLKDKGLEVTKVPCLFPGAVPLIWDQTEIGWLSIIL